MVTDIDDTIKTTEILKGRAAVLRNTFLKAFEAVPGMRDRYAAYGDGVDFHYVLGAPWQPHWRTRSVLDSKRAGSQRERST